MEGATTGTLSLLYHAPKVRLGFLIMACTLAGAPLFVVPVFYGFG